MVQSCVKYEEETTHFRLITSFTRASHFRHGLKVVFAFKRENVCGSLRGKPLRVNLVKVVVSKSKMFRLFSVKADVSNEDVNLTRSKKVCLIFC